jgi:hypothetical protein
LIGVGGSEANCSHAVNDFRKHCGIATYSPVDNVSELITCPHDEGWETVFAAWLDTSQLGIRRDPDRRRPRGDAERKISHPHVNPNWVGAVRGLGRGLGTAWSAIQPCSAGRRNDKSCLRVSLGYALPAPESPRLFGIHRRSR